LQLVELTISFSQNFKLIINFDAGLSTPDTSSGKLLPGGTIAEDVKGYMGQGYTSTLEHCDSHYTHDCPS